MSFWAGKRVVVTGGGGFLGSRIVERVKAAGAIPFVPRSREYDLVDRAAARRLFQDAKAELVIHLAAVVGGIGANMAEPGQLLLRQPDDGRPADGGGPAAGVEKFVSVGTICAYPKFTPVPFREEDLWDGYPEETNAPYGLAKKMLLVQGQAYRQQYGFKSIYPAAGQPVRPRRQLRPGVVARHPGADQECVEAARTSPPRGGLGRRPPSREFLYVDDAAEGLVLATERYEKRRAGQSRARGSRSPSAT